MDEEASVNIDWSCCSPEIRQRIDKKFFEKYGLELQGSASGDIRVVSKIATVFNAVYKDIKE